MARTNIEIDDSKIERVMSLYGLSTKRAAVDFALAEVIGRADRRAILELQGTGWHGDLDELRGSRAVQF